MARAKRGGPFAMVRARMWSGALGGSRLWTVVAAVSVTRSLIRRLSGQDTVLFSRKLGPGETLVIARQAEGVSVSGPGTGNMER
ncbi:MAG: hypothetical protein QOE35_3799 [Actinomycetota bacterium]|jgi:hypothetical protein